jgi:hypothetical protein
LNSDVTTIIRLVDHKIAEVEFFLVKLGACGFDFFAARCCAGAFVASARSIIFALQAVLSMPTGFRIGTLLNRTGFAPIVSPDSSTSSEP